LKLYSLTLNPNFIPFTLYLIQYLDTHANPEPLRSPTGISSPEPSILRPYSGAVAAVHPGRVKALTWAPALGRSAAFLGAASALDRASVFLQRRPVARLLLSIYVALVHVLWLVF